MCIQTSCVLDFVRHSVGIHTRPVLTYFNMYEGTSVTPCTQCLLVCCCIPLTLSHALVVNLFSDPLENNELLFLNESLVLVYGQHYVKLAMYLK